MVSSLDLSSSELIPRFLFSQDLHAHGQRIYRNRKRRYCCAQILCIAQKAFFGFKDGAPLLGTLPLTPYLLL